MPLFLPGSSSFHIFHSLHFSGIHWPPYWWLVLYIRKASPQRGDVFAWTGDGENTEVGVKGYFKFELSAMGVVPTIGCPLGVTIKNLRIFF